MGEVILYTLLAIGGISIIYRKLTGKSIDEVSNEIIEHSSNLVKSKKNINENLQDNIKIEVEKINNESTIIELQEYLNKVLDKYAYRSKTVIHHYNINFDETNMIISSSCKTLSSEEMIKLNPAFSALLDSKDPTRFKFTIPLKEIIKLYYEQKKSTEWLIIETKLNKIDFETISDDKKDKIKAVTETQLILKNELRKDNYNCISSIIPAFHKIIITKCKSNHSLESISSFT